MACLDPANTSYQALIWGGGETQLGDRKVVRAGPTAGTMNVAQLVRDLLAIDARDAHAATRALLRLSAGISMAPLEILAIGDSKSHGGNSADGTGYRNWLRDLLDRRNIEATIVGDAAVDGGMVSTLTPLLPDVLSAHPAANVALIDVGVNDAYTNDALSTWQTRFAALVDMVLATNATIDVVVSRIQVPDTTSTKYSSTLLGRINTINASVSAVAAARVGRVVVADMTEIPSQLMTDAGWHPGEAGYLRMAQVWVQALVDAGWI